MGGRDCGGASGNNPRPELEPELPPHQYSATAIWAMAKAPLAAILLYVHTLILLEVKSERTVIEGALSET